MLSMPGGGLVGVGVTEATAGAVVAVGLATGAAGVAEARFPHEARLIAPIIKAENFHRRGCAYHLRNILFSTFQVERNPF
jgi:hypothetical protein